MAIIKRFKQESMNGLFVHWGKTSGRCRKAAILEKWPLVEIRLYYIVNPLSPNSDQNQISPNDAHTLSRD